MITTPPQKKINTEKRPFDQTIDPLSAVQQNDLTLSESPFDEYRDRFARQRVVVFIDGSNLFYAAAALGIEIDYLKLLCCLTGKARLVHAFFYTGVDLENTKQQGFLQWMQRNGYRVITKDLARLPDGSKKANLDVEIAVDMIRLSPHCDTAVLVSGDGDFTYAVNTIAYQGVRVEVVGLRSMTNEGLIQAADQYTDINNIKNQIQKTTMFSNGLSSSQLSPANRLR